MAKNRPFWHIPVTEVLDNALEQAIKEGTYSTKSDFVRSCVRERLEKLGFKPKPFEVELAS